MNRITFCMMLIAASLGCDRASPPLAPTSTLVTVSGYVYFQDPSGGEPMIDSARISVEDSGGSRWSATTSADGFYAVRVPTGQLSITATKDGFQPKVWQVEVSRDTVLNFSLLPLTE